MPVSPTDMFASPSYSTKTTVKAPIFTFDDSELTQGDFTATTETSLRSRSPSSDYARWAAAPLTPLPTNPFYTSPPPAGVKSVTRATFTPLPAIHEGIPSYQVTIEHTASPVKPPTPPYAPPNTPEAKASIVKREITKEYCHFHHRVHDGVFFHCTNPHPPTRNTMADGGCELVYCKKSVDTIIAQREWSLEKHPHARGTYDAYRASLASTDSWHCPRCERICTEPDCANRSRKLVEESMPLTDEDKEEVRRWRQQQKQLQQQQDTKPTRQQRKRSRSRNSNGSSTCSQRSKGSTVAEGVQLEEQQRRLDLFCNPKTPQQRQFERQGEALVAHSTPPTQPPPASCVNGRHDHPWHSLQACTRCGCPPYPQMG